MQTIQDKVKDALGGDNLSALESVSLHLNKMANIDPSVFSGELKSVCKLAKKHKDKFKEFYGGFAVKDSVKFTLTLAGRMLVNHTGGVLGENANLCLHRYFGYPYIPGSALKGIARYAAWCSWLELVDAGKLNEAKSMAHSIAIVFGYPTSDRMPKRDATRKESDYLDNFLALQFPNEFGEKGKKNTFAGTIAFYPAYPANSDWDLVVDVLTSHKDSDTENPVPVFFPAVERGVKFQFTVAPLCGRCEKDKLDFGIEFLKKGLIENGVGAKTAAGYGWFEADSCEVVVDVASLSIEELEARYQTEVKALTVMGFEEHIDSLESKHEVYQKLYIERFLREKTKLLRKWDTKGNSRLEILKKVAEKINLELRY